MSSSSRIPFNKPGLAGREWLYVNQAIADGHSSGDGAFTRKCHAFLEQLLGSPKALLTTSCTHALEMAALLLDIQPGDEVIVPSFTFVSTVNAFVLRGARHHSGGRQCPRLVCQIQRTKTGHVRRPGFAELSRNQERNLRRGRSAHYQQPALRGAGGS